METSSITIENIRESDFEALYLLFAEFAAFENMTDNMTNSVEQMYAEKEYINGVVAKEDGDEIVGYATYFFTYHTFVGKCLYMDDLYIRPKYRGKGLGKQLIDKVIDFAKDNKCAKLRWQVSNWNEPAIRFYENLGGNIDNIEMNVDLFLGGK